MQNSWDQFRNLRPARVRRNLFTCERKVSRALVPCFSALRLQEPNRTRRVVSFQATKSISTGSEWERGLFPISPHDPAEREILGTGSRGFFCRLAHDPLKRETLQSLQPRQQTTGDFRYRRKISQRHSTAESHLAKHRGTGRRPCSGLYSIVLERRRATAFRAAANS